MWTPRLPRMAVTRNLRVCSLVTVLGLGPCLFVFVFLLFCVDLVVVYFLFLISLFLFLNSSIYL